MPEIVAAHLERVAKAVALDYEIWCDHIDDRDPAKLEEIVAAALAACAREARIAEHARNCIEYEYDYAKRRNRSCGFGWSCARRAELEAPDVPARQD